MSTQSPRTERLRAKNLWVSKTVLTNVAIALASLSSLLGLIPVDQEPALASLLIALVNIILRLLTTQPVSLFNNSSDDTYNGDA